MRPLLPDDGPHSLGWDEEIHNLLLRILEGQDKTEDVIPTGAAPLGSYRVSTMSQVVGWPYNQANGQNGAWIPLWPGAPQMGSLKNEPEHRQPRHDKVQTLLEKSKFLGYRQLSTDRFPVTYKCDVFLLCLHPRYQLLNVPGLSTGLRGTLLEGVESCLVHLGARNGLCPTVAPYSKEAATPPALTRPHGDNPERHRQGHQGSLLQGSVET